jgi:hypothetical protein
VGSKLRRRELIGSGFAAAGALALGPEFWQTLARPARVGRGPYGPLGPPDANGLQLPEGFRSRVIARGMRPVERTDYIWHNFSDGAATFAARDGGWILVSNSEIPTPGMWMQCAAAMALTPSAFSAGRGRGSRRARW